MTQNSNPEIIPVSNHAPEIRIKVFFTLVNLRKGNNISQQELAVELGITQGHLSAVETGRKPPSPELLRKIADYFDKEVDELHIDNPTTEMALQLIGEDVYDLYHGGKGTLNKEVRQHLLQVIRTLKPAMLAEETVVTKIDKDGNQLRESVQRKLAQLGVT